MTAPTADADTLPLGLCGHVLPAPARTGRPADYCSDRCRKAAHRQRQAPIVAAPPTDGGIVAALWNATDPATDPGFGFAPLDVRDFPAEVLDAARARLTWWNVGDGIAFAVRRYGRNRIMVTRRGGVRADFDLLTEAQPRGPIRCDTCGATIDEPTATQRYCSRRCKEGARRRPLTPYSVVAAVGVRDGDRSRIVVVQVDDAVLYRDGAPLSLTEVTAFVCAQPRTAKRVSWSFPLYAASALLAEMPEWSKRRAVTSDLYVEDGVGGWHKYVPAVKAGGFYACATRRPAHRYDYGFSVRPLRELFKNDIGEAMEAWCIGTDAERARLRDADRGHFLLASDGQDARELAALQVRLVGALMTEVEATLRSHGVKVPAMTSAGGLGASLLKRHRVAEHIGSLTGDVGDAVRDAVVGGRSEGAIYGCVPGLFDFDLRSAYGAFLMHTPCTADGHGEWRRSTTMPDEASGLRSVVRVAWRCPDGAMWGPLPWRDRDGGVWWPREGVTTVYDREVRAAIRLYGPDAVTVLDVFTWHPTCSCPPPFAWLGDVFALRVALDAFGAGRGDVAKLAITATHGLLNRRGETDADAPWYSPFHYGVVTSDVRAALLDAIAQAPERVVAVNVDGLHSIGPLDLPPGDLPGQWKGRHVGEWFAGGAGRGWTPAGEVLMRAQGLVADELRAQDVPAVLVASWRHDWRTAAAPYRTTRFLTLGEAVAQGRPDLTGTWVTSDGALGVDHDERERPVVGEFDGMVFTVAGSDPRAAVAAAVALGDIDAVLDAVGAA